VLIYKYIKFGIILGLLKTFPTLTLIFFLPRHTKNECMQNNINDLEEKEKSNEIEKLENMSPFRRKIEINSKNYMSYSGIDQMYEDIPGVIIDHSQSYAESRQRYHSEDATSKMINLSPGDSPSKGQLNVHYGFIASRSVDDVNAINEDTSQIIDGLEEVIKLSAIDLTTRIGAPGTYSNYKDNMFDPLD
jgi:hypothetical protein